MTYPDAMPNSDDTQANVAFTQQQILRYVVKEAVDREVGIQVAPLNNHIQILQGQLKQFDKDVGALTYNLTELRNVVLGNEALGIRGVSRQINEVAAKVDTLIDQREAIDNQLKGIKSTVRWGLGALSILLLLLDISSVQLIIDALRTIF